jgi:hypothetical protein
VYVASVVECIEVVQTGEARPVGPAGVDFVCVDRDCIEVYVQKDGYAEVLAEQIASERARAMSQVCRLLEVQPVKVTVVVYSDPTVKLFDTGHMGAGWARGSTVIEVLNERERVDPFHELVHILSEQLGNPPAVFREGLAVFISETLGAQAVSGHRDIMSAARLLLPEFMPLPELLALPEIGPPDSRPDVTYVQSAAVVKFLVETYGWSRFRAAYEATGRPSVPYAGVSASLRDAFGLDCQALERECLLWLKQGHQ